MPLLSKVRPYVVAEDLRPFRYSIHSRHRTIDGALRVAETSPYLDAYTADFIESENLRLQDPDERRAEVESHDWKRGESEDAQKHRDQLAKEADLQRGAFILVYSSFFLALAVTSLIGTGIYLVLTDNAAPFRWTTVALGVLATALNLFVLRCHSLHSTGVPFKAWALSFGVLAWCAGWTVWEYGCVALGWHW